MPDQPLTLCFQDKTQIPVLRAPRVFEQEQLLQPLVQRCTPAPFGKGRRTRYDRSVRNPSSSRPRAAPSPFCTSTPKRRAF